MPVDRKKWPKKVFEGSFPKWNCPHCGHTIAVNKDGVREEESGESREARGSDAWEPEWIHGRFVAECSCSNCSDPATILGSYQVVAIPTDRWAERQEYASEYEIEFIHPAPMLIRMPEALPESLVKQLGKAFGLFWNDGAACANAIRGVVEEFLNHARIRKTDGSRSKKGRLSLHKRIELFAKKDEHLGKALMAGKWIGNVGSHAGEVPRDGLFDGFDILEHVLEESFDSPRKHVARISSEVIRRRGPRRK